MACLAKPWFWLSLALLPGWAHAQIYTCKDASGRTLSADRPIQECANRPMREISRDGWVRREIPAPLTAEQKRQLELQQEQRKAQEAALEEQRQFDRVLMMRYSSEAGIEAARKRDVQVMQDQILESNRIISEAELQQQPAALPHKRDLAQQAIRSETQNISQTQAAIVQAHARYDLILKRYRELNAR